jgi:hypothetical protein
MTRRPAREIVREGALFRMGWALAPVLVGVGIIARVMTFALVIIGTGCIALGGLWLWIALPHDVLAGLAWTLGVLLGAIAMTARTPRTRVLLLLSASLLIAAAITAVLEG